MGGNVAKGTAKQIADILEEWYTSEACDGFVLSMPVQPRALRDFVDLVIPELQRRGLFRTEYASTTLRGNMGLALPPDPFAAPNPPGKISQEAVVSCAPVAHESAVGF